VEGAGKLSLMTRRDAQPITLEVAAWQNGNYVVLDWRLYRSTLAGAMRRLKRQRRVLVRWDEPLTEAALTVFVGRMAAYVLASTKGTAYVPRHLSWREVGSTEWSVPPSGGEGGENLTVHPPLTERGM